ncbi:MAG: phage baseplate assembly protein V, partial [Acidobacteriaceae bacterium]
TGIPGSTRDHERTSDTRGGGMMYLGNDLVELIKHMIEQRAHGLAVALSGTISSVDPNTYRAKVLLDIPSVETGWLPIGTMLAGLGYGVMAMPIDGTHVMVLFEGGDGQGSDQYASGKIVLCDFNAVDTVPTTTLQPGEILMQSVGDASVKLDAAGHITLNGGSEGVATVGDTASGTVTINGVSYPVTVTIQTGSATVKA